MTQRDHQPPWGEVRTERQLLPVPPEVSAQPELSVNEATRSGSRSRRRRDHEVLSVDWLSTGSLMSIDQTVTGPLVGLDQVQTGALLRLDLLDTVELPSLQPQQSNQQSMRAAPDETAQETHKLRAHKWLGSQRMDAPGQVLRSGSSSPGVLDLTTARLSAVIARTETYASLLRRLLRSSGFYAIASLGAPMVSLVLTPFLVHFLAPTDYGIFAVLNIVITLAAGISQLGLGSAFFRAYNYDYTSERDRRAVLATVSFLLFVVATPLVVGAVTAAPFLATLLFGEPALASLITITALVVFVQNLSVPGFAWLRAENRALFYSLLSLANILTSLAANLVFVGILHLGIAGALLAIGAGYATAVIGTMPVILAHSRLRIRADIARSLLTFGAPLVMSVISIWILQLSDRYLLGVFGTWAQTASYSVAYSLGSVLSTLVLSPFSLAWPTAMYTIARRRDAHDVFRMVFRWFSSVLLFAAFGLSLVSTALFGWLFPPSYHPAVVVIPIIAASIAFYGVYTVLMTGANIRRKTWMTAVFTSIAALINLGLNLLLIPRAGALGAATSTLIAYIVLAAIAYVVNRRIYPVRFQVGWFAFAAMCGACVFFISTMLPRVVGTRWTWEIAIAGLLVYGIWLVMLGIGTSSTRPHIR
jgi:O-antigen/teichoic acid export membrane protein